MTLKVLNVAYPLAPVCLDAVGGAEQVLAQLDRALHESAQCSLVVALAGSRVRGRLIEIPAFPPPLDAGALRRSETIARGLTNRAIRRHGVDLVHIHAVDFASLLPQSPIPTLITLHLPRNYYATSDLLSAGTNVWMHCVSRAQHEAFADIPRLLEPIENGVDTDRDAPYRGPREYALWLGRICPEKALHLAIDSCRRAHLPLQIAGRTFPYPAHLDYFRNCVAPRLNGTCRYLGVVSGDRKRGLLRRARCLLITTLVPETSSLVAREALAAGTPVVGLRSPALIDLIQEGKNGFLVDRASDLAQALKRCAHIEPEVCLRTAREHCALERMIDRYLHVYRTLAGGGSSSGLNIASDPSPLLPDAQAPDVHAPDLQGRDVSSLEHQARAQP